MVSPYTSALFNRTPGLLGSPFAGGLLGNGGSNDLYSLLGIDPKQARWNAMSQALAGAAEGVLSGRGLGQAIPKALLGAGYGMRQARRDTLDEALLGLRGREYAADLSRAERERLAEEQQAQDIELIGQNPPATWKGTRAEWAAGVRLDPEKALGQYDQKELHFMIEQQGGQQRQVGVDPYTGQRVAGSETQWAPRWQPQQESADTGMWETVDMPGVGQVQRNKRTGKVEGMPGGYGGSDWLTGKGPGGVDFKYNPKSGETNLARPSGGFFSLDEIRGAIPEGQPLVPRIQQPGGGPAFDWGQFKGSGSVTPAQSANDQEIDAARAYLKNSGMEWDDILSRSQEFDAVTGQPNLNYDPYIGSSYRLALQHKVGDDPEFNSIQQRYRGGGTGGDAAASIGQSPTLTGSGTQGDPYAPQSEADFENIEPGQYYVDPGDGQIYQKVQ